MRYYWQSYKLSPLELTLHNTIEHEIHNADHRKPNHPENGHLYADHPMDLRVDSP